MRKQNVMNFRASSICVGIMLSFQLKRQSVLEARFFNGPYTRIRHYSGPLALVLHYGYDKSSAHVTF